jgi:hypothetical protein
MVRRLMRLAFWIAVLAAVGAAVAKLLRSREEPEEIVWPDTFTPRAEPSEPTAPEPLVQSPVENAAERTDVSEAAWLEPGDDGCPDSHPVKAKLASGIYHLPGGLNYDRTQPDRCYRSAEDAEADGLRPAKR